MKSFGPKTFIYPMPVMVIATYDENNDANAMTAAWGGVYDTNKVFICLSADHKTVANIKAKKCFSIAFADKSHVAEADYLGIVSGNDEQNKIKKASLKIIKSNIIDAPILIDFPVSIECDICSLYEENDTVYLVGNILNVLANEEYIDQAGNIDILKMGPLVYDPCTHNYCCVSSIVGKAYHDGLKIK
ncbi:MAG: flavin reductase family protein [Bacilli bacterium]|nr:flavin reductase family protein [Bacilli bacterium]